MLGGVGEPRRFGGKHPEIADHVTQDQRSYLISLESGALRASGREFHCIV